MNMSGSIPSQLNFGSFVPTTNVWDIQQLQQLDIDPKLKELLVRLYQNVNNIALVLNTKDSGLYVLQEFLNGQVFFTNPDLNSTSAQSPVQRQVFRMVINFGALPNATTTSLPHGIDISTAMPSTFSFTRIYGVASQSSQMSFIPIPYSSATAVINNIELSVTDSDVIITTAIDYSAYDTCYVILEYLKF